MRCYPTMVCWTLKGLVAFWPQQNVEVMQEGNYTKNYDIIDKMVFLSWIVVADPCNFSMRLAIQRKKVVFYCILIELLLTAAAAAAGQGIEWLYNNKSFGVSWILRQIFLSSIFSLSFFTFDFCHMNWRKQTYFSWFAQYQTFFSLLVFTLRFFVAMLNCESYKKRKFWIVCEETTRTFKD